MASLQSKAAMAVLRALKPPARHDEAGIVNGMRALSFAGLVPYPVPRGARIEGVADAAIHGEVVRFPVDSAACAVLYLHGGGYIAGSPVTHRRMTVTLARRLAARVFAPEYRLAPEHRFPAALDDALAAYAWLRRTGESPRRIVVAGDSAGGGLALALLVALKQRGEPMPAACVALSPWVDLAASCPSILTNSRSDPMFYGQAVPEAARVYLGSADSTDPRASPMYADFAGFPPLQLFVSTCEVLRDETLLVARRARDAGVAVELHAWDDLPHCWPLAMGLLPEADQAIDLIVSFMIRNLREV